MDKKALEVWKETLSKMTFNQLLQVECKMNANVQWKKMFIAVPDIKEALKCALCDTAFISKMICIRQHILGKKHIKKIEQTITTIRHKSINPFKPVATEPDNENTQGQGNITAKAPTQSTQQSNSNESPAMSNNQTQQVANNTVKPAAQGNKQPNNISTQQVTTSSAKPVTQMNKSLNQPKNETQQSTINNPSGTQQNKKSDLPSSVKSNNQSEQKIAISTPKRVTRSTAATANNQSQQNVINPAAKFASKCKLRQKIPSISYPNISTDSQTQQNASNNTANSANEVKEQVNSNEGEFVKSSSQQQRESNDLKSATQPNSSTSEVSDQNKQIKTTTKNTLQTENVNTGTSNSTENKDETQGTEVGTSKSINDNSSLRKCQTPEKIIKANSEQSPNLIVLSESENCETNSQDLNTFKSEHASKTLVINPANLATRKEIISSGKHLKELMKSFELDDLMMIEFRYSGFPWRPMFKQIPDQAFKCLLCGTFILKNFNELRKHNESVRHETSINAVEKLFHPKFAPTKADSEFVAVSEQDKKNKSTDDSATQITSQAFRNYIQNMSLEEMKQIEFLASGAWQRLIGVTENVTTCNLCNGTNIFTHTDLVDHFATKEHSGFLSRVDKFFHPSCTLDRFTLEQNTKNRTEAPGETQPITEDTNVICIEDSPEREIADSVNKNGEPKKFVNPVAIMAQTNKNISVIQNNDRSLIRSQYHASPQMPAYNMMSPTFPTPIVQTPSFSYFNPGETFGPPVVVSTQLLEHDNITFATKNLANSKIQEIEGFIGIEYVVKILRNSDDDMPRYECCLCEIESDGLGMQIHLKGLLHRIKFLERHFPTAMRQFSKYKDNVKHSSIMTQVCEKLAIAIEKYHGRDLPYECLHEEFRSNRDRIMSKVFSFRHASEHSGPSFTNVVDKKTLDEIIANSDYKMPEPDTNRVITFDPKSKSSHKRRAEPLDVEQHKKLVERFLENTSLPNAKRRAPYSRSPQRSYNRRSPPHRSARKSPFNEDWDKYKRMFDHAVKDLDADYDEYKKDPEKHPIYDEEWKDYWLRKSRSLRNVGIDPSTYNFQPGWVRYFSRRIHQLYEAAVEDIRRNLRERLGLPNHNERLSDDKYHIGVHCVSDEINDEDDLLEEEDLEYARRQNELEDEVEIIKEEKNRDTSVGCLQVTHQNNGDSMDEEERCNVVPVLRLLTALEDQLGSLGPKVNDLLSKALTLEKVKPNACEENLITYDNCVFLETVNEKLKGQVFAGMITGNKLKAVKQAINDLSDLLQVANKMIINKPRTSESEKEETRSGPITGAQKRPIRPAGPSEQPPKKQCLDKEEIATKLAAALAAQGKTDFSSEQLEQLVAVYTLIEKKQRETSAAKKTDFLNEQQQKSLSETLLDFLKPGNEKAVEKVPQAPQYGGYSHSNNSSQEIKNPPPLNFNNNNTCMTNRRDNSFAVSTASSSMMGTSSRLQNRPSLLSNNFNHLREFDTSLNISSLNRNTTAPQSWIRNQNEIRNPSFNMNVAQGSFRPAQPFMNQNQNNTRNFNANINQMRSSPWNHSPKQAFMNQGNMRQLSSNVPVITSNTMLRGGAGVNNVNNNNNPPMISYPQANMRQQNQKGNNSLGQSSMQKDNRLQQPPIGWQRNNPCWK